MVDRHEEFFATVVRQGLTATLVTGVDRQGKVQAQKMHYLWNCGGYGGYGVARLHLDTNGTMFQT